jgi:6-pyruvoyltetrahydropterin/6-carboxytetrahydropterin synthase
MYSVTRRFTFCAAHRLLGHTGKCRYIHGHNYVAEVRVKTLLLNDRGMVVDFADLKKIGEWIDKFWDHNIILHPDDPLAVFWTNRNAHDISIGDQFPTSFDVFGDKAPFIMPGKMANPTAENMARGLCCQASVILGDIPIYNADVHVRLYETESCWAEYPSR